jgi:hypothetical protein
MAPKTGIQARPWPKDKTKTVDFEQLCRPVVSLIRQGYRLVRRRNPAFSYRGYDTGPSLNANILPLAGKLSPVGIEHEKDQNRTLLETIVSFAIQLGFEQGVRHTERRYVPIELLARDTKKLIKQDARRRKSSSTAKNPPSISVPRLAALDALANWDGETDAIELLAASLARGQLMLQIVPGDNDDIVLRLSERPGADPIVPAEYRSPMFKCPYGLPHAIRKLAVRARDLNPPRGKP